MPIWSQSKGYEAEFNGGWLTMPSREWEYKGHQCRIAFERDRDCITTRHHVTTPKGVHRVALISSYDRWQETVELWIDAGLPDGRCVIDGQIIGNWDYDLLALLIANELTAENYALRTSAITTTRPTRYVY